MIPALNINTATSLVAYLQNCVPNDINLLTVEDRYHRVISPL